MVYEYLREKYKDAEPIFYSDLHFDGMSKSALSHELKNLCDKGKIKKYDRGIYYFPKKVKIFDTVREVGPTIDEVANEKYIKRNEKFDGYYARNTFANMLGISMQVPMKLEFVSNNISSNEKEVIIKNRVFYVRKPRVKVNNENIYVLQMLDLLSEYNWYSDYEPSEDRVKFIKYIDKNGITREDVEKYIDYFPRNVYKYYFLLRLDNVFAQGK